MAQKITKNQIAAQESWIAPTLTNSWANFGGVYGSAAYMKDSMGFVHLRGLIKSGSLGAAAFTLPAGYRPAAQIYQITASNAAVGILDIKTDGSVQPSSGSTASFSLEGITFMAGA